MKMTKVRRQNHILARGKKGLALMFLEVKQHPLQKQYEIELTEKCEVVDIFVAKTKG